MLVALLKQVLALIGRHTRTACKREGQSRLVGVGAEED